MQKHSQLNFVKQVLREKGEISRNFCLQNYISRLGARIIDLKAEGWEFETLHRDGDYVYKLKKTPYIPKLVWSEEKQAMVYQPKQENIW